MSSHTASNSQASHPRCWHTALPHGPRLVRIRALSILVCSLLAGTGCSMLGSRSRPDPDAENVRCNLEYQPLTQHAEQEGHDLLFLAISSPYREETFNMSLPDVMFHGMFAPGRHLSRDAIVTGAVCSGPPWKKGFRLPRSLSSHKWMLCRRNGNEAVMFQVETRWGSCSRHIAAGDMRPIAFEHNPRQVVELPELGPETDR